MHIMKKVFFVGLIAMLISCTKEYSSPENSSIDLQLNLSFGSISTRAVDGSIIGSDGKGYVLPFTEVKTLKVELYKSLNESPIFTYTASSAEITNIQATPSGELASLSIPKIPVATQFVKIIINPFSEANPDINKLQVTNRDLTPAPTMGRENIPYEGTSEMVVIPEESTLYNTKVRATVEVAPLLCRFEVVPGAIVITDPVNARYTFDWTDGAAGKAKITHFTEAQVSSAEASACENFKQKYSVAPPATATYSYRVRVIRPSLFENIDINALSTEIYVNYFKQMLNSASIVKNTNDNISSWSALYYSSNQPYSNLYDTRTTESTKVNAFHLFPQKVANNATLQETKDGMPHIIFEFTYTPQQPSRAAGSALRRWLTIRAFKNKDNNQTIHSFEPGYCYALDLDDIALTPWSLGLEVRVTDNGKMSESDPIIKDFDQTSHVPEPEDGDLTIGLKVSKWREKNLETEL